MDTNLLNTNLQGPETGDLQPEKNEAGRPPVPAAGLTTQGVVRTMMIFAAEGAFDLQAGYGNSPYLDRFNALFEEHSRALEAFPASSGGADLRLLLRRASEDFGKFGETVRRDILEGVDKETGKGNLDEALERVKESAIRAAASLESARMAMSKT